MTYKSSKFSHLRLKAETFETFFLKKSLNDELIIKLDGVMMVIYYL